MVALYDIPAAGHVLEYKNPLPSSINSIVTTMSYFDPTNRVYQVGFDFLFPELAKEQWNVETKGDIVESILGYGWQMELAPTNIKEPWQLAVRRLSSFLDEIFYHIYCTC